jgi:hypothetical protein
MDGLTAGELAALKRRVKHNENKSRANSPYFIDGKMSVSLIKSDTILLADAMVRLIGPAAEQMQQVFGLDKDGKSYPTGIYRRLVIQPGRKIHKLILKDE